MNLIGVQGVLSADYEGVRASLPGLSLGIRNPSSGPVWPGGHLVLPQLLLDEVCMSGSLAQWLWVCSKHSCWAWGGCGML